VASSNLSRCTPIASSAREIFLRQPNPIAVKLRRAT